MVPGVRRAAVFRNRKFPMDDVLRITAICKIVTASGNSADSCQGQRSLLTDRKLDKNKAGVSLDTNQGGRVRPWHSSVIQ